MYMISQSIYILRLRYFVTHVKLLHSLLSQSVVIINARWLHKQEPGAWPYFTMDFFVFIKLDGT